MLVHPLPGTDRRTLRTVLRDVSTALRNLSRQSAPDYLAWADNSARVLDSLVTEADIARLVLTPRWELLLTQFTATGRTVAVLNVEIDRQIKLFEKAEAALAERIEAWSDPGLFVALDTSVFINAAKIEEIDLHAIIRSHEDGYAKLKGGNDRVHALVPLVVVDELDRLKDSGKSHTRWRAGYTLAVIDRLFWRPDFRPVLYERPVDFHPEAATMELLMDPPGHRRLQDEDDEIVDRLVHVQPLTARPITLITYDTGMSMRARHAGLEVIKVSRELGDEPPEEPQRSSRGKSTPQKGNGPTP